MGNILETILLDIQMSGGGEKKVTHSIQIITHLGKVSNGVRGDSCRIYYMVIMEYPALLLLAWHQP